MSLSSARIAKLTIQKDNSENVLNSKDAELMKRINDSSYSLRNKPVFKKNDKV